jgi:hypothetical protein
VRLSQTSFVTRRSALALLLGSIASHLPGCKAAATKKYRVRLLVEADGPTGRSSAHSVIEIRGARKLRLTSEEQASSIALRGQAVRLDSPDGALFVLLKPRGGGSLAATITKYLAPEFETGSGYDLISAVEQLGSESSVGRRATLPRWTKPITASGEGIELWPWVVRFDDPTDPSSVEEVDPEAAGIERIIAEVTTDTISGGIEEHLPWLPGWHGALDAHGDPNRSRPPVKKLTRDAFLERTDA